MNETQAFSDQEMKTLFDLIIDQAPPLHKARWHTITSDPETLSFWPSPFTYEQAEGWVNRAIKSYSDLGYGRYALIEKESSILVGDCGFLEIDLLGNRENDLGYILDKEYWGRGLATEAAKACLNFGIKSLGMKRMVATMETSHLASKKVAEKIGFSVTEEFINEKNCNKPTYLMIYEL